MKHYLSAVLVLLGFSSSAQVNMQGDISKCPVHGGAASTELAPKAMDKRAPGNNNRDWWAQSIESKCPSTAFTDVESHGC